MTISSTAIVWLKVGAGVQQALCVIVTSNRDCEAMRGEAETVTTLTPRVIQEQGTIETDWIVLGVFVLNDGSCYHQGSLHL